MEDKDHFSQPPEPAGSATQPSLPGLEPPALFELTTDRASPGPPPATVYSTEQTVVTRGDDGHAFWEETKSFVRDLIFSVLVAVLVIVFVVQPVRVEGTSMLPHLHDGERIFVNKFLYSPFGKIVSQGEPIARGDIVVFWFPNDPEKSFIKRVIGLSGETVSIRDGVVYINGQVLDEPYIQSPYHHRFENMPGTFVRNHYYFVMGDNRDASNDSRQWGLVPEKYIYGKAIFRYWPPGNVGTLK